MLQENQAYISNFEALIIALQLRSPSTNGPDVACDLFHQTAELTFCVKVVENGNNTSHDLFILPQFDNSDTSVCKKARGTNQG